MSKRICGVFVALVGALVVLQGLKASHNRIARGAAEAAQTAPASPSLETLQADVAQLKDKASDQAHAMTSVAYHFNNLWFAAQAGNWALAEFYWGETRSHLRWAVRIIPVRKDSAGQDIKLRDILEAVENSPLAQLQTAIQDHDQGKVVAAYRFMLESCYACHKAVEKPYLRPRIPLRPAEPTINFDPYASWPQ